MIMLKDDVARDITQFFEHCEGVCVCVCSHAIYNINANKSFYDYFCVIVIIAG